MGGSSVYFAKPTNAPSTGYETDGQWPGSIWRMQIPVGETRDVLLVGPAGTGSLLGVTSNNDSVVKNDEIQLRAVGSDQLVTLRGSRVGTTQLDIGMVRFGSSPPRFGPDVPFQRPVGGDYINVHLQVQVTRTDGSMPGNDSGVRPEGQNDATMCWAACLTWWLRALPDRIEVSQSTLLTRAAGIWDSDGTLSIPNLQAFYQRQNVGISCQTVTPSALQQYMVPSKLPMIIGFRTGVMGGHVNVIHSIDVASGTVTVMEPWFPDPSIDKNYHLEKLGVPVFLNNTDNAPFLFRGAHLKRPITYYTSKPMRQGFLVCHPY